MGRSHNRIGSTPSCCSAPVTWASNPVTRDLQNALRDLPDPIPAEFARDFQASTAHRPLPAEFFERIVAESLKLPPRLWRLAIGHCPNWEQPEHVATDIASMILRR